MSNLMKVKRIFVMIVTVKKMKNEILMNDVLKELDELILKFDVYYTFENLKK